MFRKLREVIVTMRRHRQDPEDVAKGVHMIDALSALLGRGDRTMVRRMRSSAEGRRILETRKSMLDVLADRPYLRSLPEGTLGREYVSFADANQLFPEKLAEAVVTARAATGGQVPNASDDVAFLNDRYRDLHDLWHIVTRYGTDLAGEYGIVALQTQQVGYRAMAITGFVSMLLTALAQRRLDLVATWFEGRRRGREGVFLLAEDWESLIHQPVHEVRERLGFGRAPSYRPFDYASGPAAAAQAA